MCYSLKMKQNIDVLLTSCGIAVTVDSDIYNRLNGGNLWKRRSGKNGAYLYFEFWSSGRRMQLHRYVAEALPHEHVDHINGDRLDNRRSNLRVCTRKQNNRNTKNREGSTSKYKGVTWDKEAGKWRARIYVDGKSIHLGRYEDEKEAALVYNEAALLHFKDFAFLNTFS